MSQKILSSSHIGLTSANVGIWTRYWNNMEPWFPTAAMNTTENTKLTTTNHLRTTSYYAIAIFVRRPSSSQSPLDGFTEDEQLIGLNNRVHFRKDVLPVVPRFSSLCYHITIPLETYAIYIARHQLATVYRWNNLELRCSLTLWHKKKHYIPTEQNNKAKIRKITGYHWRVETQKVLATRKF